MIYTYIYILIMNLKILNTFECIQWPRDTNSTKKINLPRWFDNGKRPRSKNKNGPNFSNAWIPNFLSKNTPENYPPWN